MDTLFQLLSEYAKKSATSEGYYRIKVAEIMVALKDKGTPASLCETLARGNKEVAQAKIESELNKMNFDIAMSKYQWLKMKYKEYSDELQQEYRSYGGENNV